jgi:hypothetical protein
MTTRAGTIGLITGAIATILSYLFFFVLPLVYMRTGWLPASWPGGWTGEILIGLVFSAGGAIAARRSGAAKPWRCATLGALAGGLAGTVVFCLWGAAHAGMTVLFLDHLVFNSRVYLTMSAFIQLFAEGTLLGGLGGWLGTLGRKTQAEPFDLEDPQMAMNAFITAVPASVFAALLTAEFFPRLTTPAGDDCAVYLPLYVALLLVLISQLVLMLVVPHETRMAQHRCGTDEVKMAAFVGIATAPVLALLLALAAPQSYSRPLVDAALLLSVAMSLWSVRDLVKVVLPKRASFAAPQGDEKTRAVLFGSIGESKALRLVVLCTGCGLTMVLPLEITVVSVLVNLQYAASTDRSFWQLYVEQAAVSLGCAAVAVAALVLIYMVYLYMGKNYLVKNPSHNSRL